jgi:UPF0148 protein
VFRVLSLSKRGQSFEKMVDLLKQGATLTELACPACASPLFRFKSGDLWCAKCEKRVVVLKEGQSAENASSQAKLTTLENTLMAKIEAVEAKIRDEEDASELQKLNGLLTSLLESLERLKRVRT